MKPYHNNPRKISQAQYQRLQETLAELGDLSGIVHDLNSDEVIGGNQRSKVFDLSKMQPVITERLDTPNAQGTIARGFIEWQGERFSYRAVRWTTDQCDKDNIVANLAGGSWDSQVLAGWDRDLLKVAGMDDEWLRGMSADVDDLSRLLQPEEETPNADAEPQIDRAEELNQKWRVKTGDLWRIGEHRLLCGDSETGINRIVGSYNPHATIADPPYGIEIVKGLSSADGGAKPFGRVRQPGGRQPHMVGKVGVPGVVEPRLYRPVANDNRPFDPAWLLNLTKVVILFGANHFASRLPDSPAWIVWEKNVSDQSTFSACELAWCNIGNHVRRYEWTWSGMVRAGDREVEMKDRIHPTQKPVGMIENIIRDYTEERDVIIDPYLGSGTTMLAAARTNRICVGGELDEAYCAVILERMATAFPGIEIERLT